MKCSMMGRASLWLAAIVGMFGAMTPAVRGVGSGLTGQYFDNNDFTTLIATRVDPAIDFKWGTSAPTNTMGADTFSVRWSGQIEPLYSETYFFYVTADDGFRLWIDDRLIMARTTYSAAAAEMVGRLSLEAGKRYNIVLEVIEGTGQASAQLEWSSASQTREIVPTAQLYPAEVLPETGSIMAETWMNLPGSSISTLTSSTNYPNRPDAREILISFESLVTNWADAYGTRISGWLQPPTNGVYTFAVAGDDYVQLFLSTNASAAGKRLIASNSAPTAFRNFSASPGQTSTPIALNAFTKYYVEVLHKESTGNDHFSVAWQVPGATNLTVIPAEALIPAGVERTQPAQTAYMDTLSPTHPRLFATPQRFEWVRRTLASNSVPQMTSWWLSNSNAAYGFLSQPPLVYDKDVRGTVLNTARQVLDRIYRLAFAYRMTGDTNFAERAWTELDWVASTNWPDWNPAHFLDTAETTHAFAIGYDWLYQYWTPSRRDTIRTAIIEKGLKQSLSIYTNTGWWAATSANNWNLVCNGGMVMGALAVAEDNEAMSEYILFKAVASATAVMRHYTIDNGAWYEGPGYWDYTTDYNFRLMASLESALGSDLGMSDVRGVWEVGMEPYYMVGPLKQSFNFADAGAGNIRGPQLFWLARRYYRPELSWYQRNNATGEILDLMWYDTRGADPVTNSMPPDNYFRGYTTNVYKGSEALTLRTRWQDGDATFVGIKGGEMGADHGNLDAGSFVLDALGQRWAVDLGADDYALPGYFSEPQRWTYYRMRAEGHNTLVINPTSSADQVVNSVPPVILYTTEPNAERSAAVVNLTSAYTISKVWRGAQILKNRKWYLVQDELQAAAPANVWWFMHMASSTGVNIHSNGTSVMLTKGTDRLWITNLTGQGFFALSNAVPLPTSPNPAGQNANTGYVKLALNLTNVTNTTLAVLMVPLNPGELLPNPTNFPPVIPLVDWGAGTTNTVIIPTNTPPTVTASNVTTAVNTTVDFDLRALASDPETATTNLMFWVGGAQNGTVALLPDGRTARFTPAAGYTGVASFKVAARDAWPDSRMLFHYDFEGPDTTSLGAVEDRSSQSRYGEITNVGTGTNYFDADAPAALAPYSKQSLFLREAGDFNGARVVGRVFPADHNINQQSWTFTGWFKRTTQTNDDFIFYLGNSDGFGSPDEFQLYMPGNSTTLTLRHYYGTSVTDLDLTRASVALGQWYHVAVSFQSTNQNQGIVSLYVNGVLAGTDSSVALNMATGESPVLGGHGTSTFAVTRWFNGRLDDCVFFNNVLSPTEISWLAGKPAAYLGGLSTTNTVFVNLLPPNNPPVLAAITNRTTYANTTLYVTNSAYDPDTPSQLLRYSLLSAPPGAMIDPVSGLITWTPSNVSTSQLTVVVREAGFASTLFPVADAYVRDGTYANSNYGSDAVLMVKQSPTAGVEREAFLKFDLGPVSGSLDSAELRLNPLSGSVPGVHALAVALSDSWTESGITWNNMPGANAALSTWTPVIGEPAVVPVTAPVQAALSSDRLISFRLYATNATADGLISYASREDAARSPVLALVSTNVSLLSATQSFWVTVQMPVPPAPPTLSSLGISGGTFSLSFTGAPGFYFQVQGSTNFSDWSTLWVTNSPGTWSDPETPLRPYRFYRVLLSPTP